MKTARISILSLPVLLLTASVAFAQGTGPTPGTGTTGTGPTTGAGAGSTPGTPATTPGKKIDADLPIKPPIYVPPTRPPGGTGTPGGGGPNNGGGGGGQGDDKPPTIFGQDIKSENNTIFYVLDISGSMGWDVGQYTKPDGSTASGNRLDRAKAELVKSVSSLPSNFKFNMLSFDCSIFTWQSAMQPADADHKAAAIGWIMSQQPQGGTGTGPAGAAGLGDKNNKLVVLLTDGGPNCGASGMQGHRAMIRAANTQGAVVNVYGIGASGSFKQFCMDVASDNGGTYTDVR